MGTNPYLDYIQQWKYSGSLVFQSVFTMPPKRRSAAAQSAEKASRADDEASRSDTESSDSTEIVNWDGDKTRTLEITTGGSNQPPYIKVMLVTETDTGCFIEGETFKFKDNLKALAAEGLVKSVSWDGDKKRWEIKTEDLMWSELCDIIHDMVMKTRTEKAK